MKRTATIKCVTACVLYSLSKKQLDEVLLHHPQMTSAIRIVAELRLKQTEEDKAAEMKAEESVVYAPDTNMIRHSTIMESQESEGETSDVNLEVGDDELTESTELRPN
jgi:CRP-like cAMP-binding protein